MAVGMFFRQDHKTFQELTKNYADVGIIGLPINNHPTQHMGSKETPQSLRQYTSKLNIEDDLYYGLNPFNSLKVIDLGDLWFKQHGQDAQLIEITDFYKNVSTKCPQIISIGGDQSITHPIIKQLNDKYKKPISIIHFDSSPDCSPKNSDSLIYNLITDKLIDVKTSIQIGIRSNTNSTNYALIKNAGLGGSIGSEILHTNDFNLTLNTIQKIIGNNPVYLSFDMSVFDPSHCPASSKIIPGGIYSWQILKILHNLQTLNLIGMDLSELVPHNDINDMSKSLASTIIWKYLCLLAVKKGKKP